MELYIRAILVTEQDKVLALKFGLMERSTKASGVRTRQMARASFGMLMAIFTKANGKTIKPMALVYTSTKMVLSTKATGKMICKTAKDSKLGATAANSKVNTRKG
jgi:hypothetical protein